VSGLAYDTFERPNLNEYFTNETRISLINDRFSVLNEMDDLT
jgi:cytochrome b559 alpha subunit